MKKQPFSGLPIVVCALVALAPLSCSAPVEVEAPSEEASTPPASEPAPPVQWGYGADDGPGVWGSLNPKWASCAEGMAQSPIDLSTASPAAMPEIGIETPSGAEVAVLNQTGVLTEIDNGHTIQVNTPGAGTLSLDGKVYHLAQFHFHGPSEHTVDGEHYPMEIHFVHQADDKALAVIGVLVDEGEENPSFGPLWAHLAEGKGAETSMRIPEGFAESIFSDAAAGFYHYSGSLTTPPCSEGVNWFVRETPTYLSGEQITAFYEVYEGNNRPTQPLNDRTLGYDESGSLTAG